jgi:hypothetical protein
MKNFSYLLFSLFFSIFVFSQTEQIDIDKSKVFFSYSKKSNYIIKDSNVYGDSIMFAIDFPNLNPIKTKHPKDSLKDYCFLPIDKFNRENKTKLGSVLYHVNEQIEGIYDPEKDKTILTFTRDDADLRKIFKTHLNKKYDKFVYYVTIDYKKKKINYKYPTVSYSFIFSEKIKKIEYNDDSFLEGNYINGTNIYIENKNVYFDKKLHPKANIDIVFLNQKYGLVKIKSVFETIELLTETK